MQKRNTVAYRKETLKKLLHFLDRYEDSIIAALHQDFKKPAFETILTEIYFVRSELVHTIKNSTKWARAKRIRPSILNFPSTDFIFSEPYGNILVISPWNYPFQLAMCPLIAAFAAGNSVVLKPSELTPATSSMISQIVAEVFDPVDVEVFQGGAHVSSMLLQRRWDYIFFTGSVAVGKLVAEAAAKFLTPVTLELGGKNPCIVDSTANLRLAAKRIVWGKFVNAGQTCIAPDYILTEASVKSRFLILLREEIIAAYGLAPESSPDLARIIDVKNHDRLTKLIPTEKVVYGGDFNRESLYISPTLIDETDPGSLVMQNEIFGPLLPVLGYSSEEELEKIIYSYEKPLALYVFTSNNTFARSTLAKFPFGGGCINDTMIQFANTRLPFGGVGNSGIGSYHGKKSFDLFSHKKPVVRKATWLDIPLRYAPYRNKIATLRKWLKWL